MKRSLILLSLVAVAAIAFSIDVSHADGLLMAMAGAAAVDRGVIAWGRIREPMKPFYNVAVSGVATSIIPRYPRSILGVILQLGGTTFAKTDIARVEFFVGEKSIWGPVSGAELDATNYYVNGPRGQDTYMLPVDFTCPNVKEIGGEQVGGLNLLTLADGVLRMEVELGSGASAPTLSGHIIWGAPQGQGPLAGLMKKLKKRVYAQMAAGDNYPAVDLRQAVVLRQYFRTTVAKAAVATAAGQGASFANTGTGAMGAITVAADTPAGRYRLVILEPISNAGAFEVFDPQGRVVGAGNVATAFVGGGLGFTLADATDYLAGDGFTIDVLANNVDSNLNLVEIKKNESVVWSRSDRAARYEATRYGRTWLDRMYVADFLLDNHSDSVLDTKDATSLDYKVNLTAADTITVIHETLEPPIA